MALESQERNKDTGNFLVRYAKSFKHALDGIWYSIIHEHNLVIILAAIIVTTTFGFIYNISSVEWIFVILCFGLVLGAELINTSIEAAIDLITMEMNPLAKIAKDTASSATLIFSLMALVGALIIFIPKIIGG